MTAACAGCGRPTTAPEQDFTGVKGDPEQLRLRPCGDDCRAELVRFAARRSAQRPTALAGYLVAALGIALSPLFFLTGRELGGVLLVLGLLGTAYTRLAYPDIVPLRLVRRLGVGAATAALQWAGVGLGLFAVGLGVWFVLR